MSKKRMNPKLVVIGAGNITPYHIISAKEAGFKVVGICSRSSSKKPGYLAEKFEIPNVFQNLQAITKVNPDAVAITVSTDSQIEILKRINKYNLPTLVEKPVSTDSKRILNFIQNFDSEKILVNFNRRYYPSVLKLHSIIEAGKDDVSFNVSIPELSWETKMKKIDAIDYFKENSVHVIDLMFYLFGGIKIVEKIEMYTRNGFAIKSILKTNRGIIGNLNINFFIKGNTHINVATKNTVYDLKPLEELWFSNTLKTSFAKKSGFYKKYQPIYKKLNVGGDFNTKSKLGFTSIYRDFELMIAGKCKKNLPRLKDAYQSSDFIDGLFG